MYMKASQRHKKKVVFSENLSDISHQCVAIEL